MSNYLVAIIVGVLSSIIASVIFLLFLTRIRPKILISHQISKGNSSKGETVYRIKIINRTRRPIMKARAQLHLMTPFVIPSGVINKSKAIILKRSEIMELSKFDLKDEAGDYAFRFLTYEDIDELWKDDAHSFLRFRIYAIDSLSGFGKVFKKYYHTKRNSIIEGDFEFGNSLEIK